MPHRLSEAAVAEYRNAFGLYDRDSNGTICTTDIGNVVRTLGFNPTQSDVKEWIKQIEINKQNKINFKEFLKIMKNNDMRDPDGEARLREAFKMFDRQGNGFLNTCELHHILVNLGEKLTETEFQDMLREANIQQDELVSIESFIKLIISK